MKRLEVDGSTYDKIADIYYFHDLCESEWGDEISKCALNIN